MQNEKNNQIRIDASQKAESNFFEVESNFLKVLKSSTSFNTLYAIFADDLAMLMRVVKHLEKALEKSDEKCSRIIEHLKGKSVAEVSEGLIELGFNSIEKDELIWRGCITSICELLENHILRYKKELEEKRNEEILFKESMKSFIEEIFNNREKVEELIEAYNRLFSKLEHKLATDVAGYLDEDLLSDMEILYELCDEVPMSKQVLRMGDAITELFRAVDVIASKFKE